ncbi:MAG: thioredoxin family protein [Archangium sp.]|nr:thioredoxin family protein [Archangium sp.]
METFRNVVVVLVVGFVALMVGLQIVAQRRAARLKGQPLPALPGKTGARIAAAEHALIYFFTPSCAACRAVTPKMKALAQQGKSVFPIDLTEDMALAQALSVMATPTTVEVDHGKVVGVHIGPVASDVWARFA